MRSAACGGLRPGCRRRGPCLLGSSKEPRIFRRLSGGAAPRPANARLHLPVFAGVSVKTCPAPHTFLFYAGRGISCAPENEGRVRLEKNRQAPDGAEACLYISPLYSSRLPEGTSPFWTACCCSSSYWRMRSSMAACSASLSWRYSASVYVTMARLLGIQTAMSMAESPM